MRENFTLKRGNEGFTVRYQVPTLMTMMITVFWNAMPCSFVNVYQNDATFTQGIYHSLYSNNFFHA
jgi:hypothetical protein